MDSAPAPSAWAVFWRTPLVLRVYLTAVAIAAVALPVVLSAPVETPYSTEWLTAGALIVFSVLNVEVSRWLSGGLSYADQPHKALSAWAFAAGLLLPTAWLLVVVPVTYTHARWRGIRLPLWKWIGSGLYLVLCGLAAAMIRHVLLGDQVNWMHGDGRRGFGTMLLAGIAFLALEALLFSGSALLNEASDEVWLRALLTGPTFYVTEAGVLFVGGLFAAVWTAGLWFTLLFVPIYVLIQHSVLLAPLRERAAAAAELAAKNAQLATTNAALEEKNSELNAANQFKTDLMSMLGHEIANPLTAVRGYAQLGVEAADDPAATHNALLRIEHNADQMAAVLADIVHLVSSERGMLTATPETVLLAPRLPAVAAATGTLRPPVIDCPPDLEVLVQPGHLDQILANLLSNAEKYAGGATRIEARLGADDRAEVSITDDGPGVPPEFAHHLFGRHQRDPGATTRATGNGLGLFISRELAKANGGDLVHRQTAGTGSSFVLVLPTP